MKKIIDKGLDFLRKHTYLNYLEKSEYWLVKIGLWGLYAVLPLISVVFIIRYHKAISMLCGSAILVALGVVVASLLLGYAAEKMLGYVKPTLNQAETKIVKGALWDVLTVIMVVVALCVFFGSVVSAIKLGSFEIFFGGLLGALVCGFFIAMLLEPQKTLNIQSWNSATPAQCLIAIASFLVKASYRLVPMAFGALIVVAVVCGLDLVFSSQAQISTIASFGNLVVGGALLPLGAYLLFLGYYFVLDFLESFFRMSNDVKSIAESKDGRKGK